MSLGTFRHARSRRAGAVAAVITLLFGTLAWWLSSPFRASAQAPAVGIHKVQGASWRPEVGQPLFIAVLGSDTRVGPPDGGGGRCDSIHIIAINPGAKAGTVLNFPRDSWVPVAGMGTTKINAACTLGPQNMVRTLTSLTGIPIQYYAITEFSHFVALVNELGGIVVPIPYRMLDSASGADFQPGVFPLSGQQALAFSRARKGVPRGDFSRAENQGILIVSALAKVRAELADPLRLFDYIRTAKRHTNFNVPVSEVVKLALLAKEIDPANIRNVTINGSVGSAGGQSVVFIAPGDTFARVRDDAIY
ncbi:MAG: LCP family protein [Actinomycetota bacterium]|nr:LCP family protein [Actinomycetota bacterium]